MTPEMIEALNAKVNDTDGIYIQGWNCIEAVLIEDPSKMNPGDYPPGVEQVVELVFLGVQLDSSGRTVYDESNRPLPILHRGWVAREEIPKLIVSLWEAFDAAALRTLQRGEADRGLHPESG